MNTMHPIKTILLIASLCVAAQTVIAQGPPSRLQRKDPVMTRHAEGTFEVKTTPLPGDDTTASTLIGRYGLAKQFHGDLEGTSKGLMLAAGEPSSGNAGYVAIEQVTGKLAGHSGSFALQHLGERRLQADRDGGAWLRNGRTGWDNRRDDHRDRQRQALLDPRVHASRNAVSRGTRVGAASPGAAHPSTAESQVEFASLRGQFCLELIRELALEVAPVSRPAVVRDSRPALNMSR